MSVQNFWSSTILKWEKQRYDGLLAHTLYRSLNYRQNYLAYIVNQLPEGSRIIEVGCGSGRLYSKISKAKKFKYTGIDISDAAIRAAQTNEPDAEWICAQIDSIQNREADYVISGGLIDWVSREEFQKFLNQNKFKYHLHSFSQNLESFSKKLHILFSNIISKKNRIAYQPRKFTLNQVQSYFSTPSDDWQIVTDPKLSFGAFIHNLPTHLNTSFNSFKIFHYFTQKKAGVTEFIFKAKEKKLVLGAILGSSLTHQTILEIGSGNGSYTRVLTKTDCEKIYALDPAIDTSDFVQSSKLQFEKCSFENYQSAQKFNWILAVGVLEFTQNLNLFLQNCVALSKPQGHIVLLAPQDTGLISTLYRQYHRLFNQIELRSDFETQIVAALQYSGKKHAIIKKDGGFLNNLFIITLYE